MRKLKDLLCLIVPIVVTILIATAAYDDSKIGAIVAGAFAGPRDWTPPLCCDPNCGAHQPPPLSPPVPERARHLTTVVDASARK